MQLHERQLIFGSVTGEMLSDRTPFINSSDLADRNLEALVATDGIDPEIASFIGHEVVPVVARKHIDVHGGGAGRIDHSAEVLMGDVSEDLSLTPFERTQMEYNGVDRRAIPTVSFDDAIDY